MSEAEKQNQNETFRRVMKNATERGYFFVNSATNLPYDEVDRRYDALRKQGSTQAKKHKHRY